MNHHYDGDRGTGTYRSRDSIENLKVKITLQNLSASTIGFITNDNKTREDLAIDNEFYKLNEFGQEIYEEKEMEIKWKEKLFSKREFDFYKEESNCSTIQDYKYHAQVMQIEERGTRKNDRIFTYLDFDTHNTMEEGKGDKENRVAEKMSGIRRRRADELGANSWRIKKGAIKGVDIVNQYPTKDFKDIHHVIDTPVQTFIIMADLGPGDIRGDPQFEKELCTIEYDDNCVLRVTPDFSKSNLAYRVFEIDNIRSVWNYKVAHTSAEIGKIQAQQEISTLDEMYKRQRDYLASLVTDRFETVPDNVLRIVVHGEIVSSANFPADNHHVEYFLDAPTGWTSDPCQVLFGCTQSCKTKELKGVETAYYSQPFNYQLYYDMSKAKREEFISPHGWPRLFVHVLSKNFYGKTSSEGYGYMDFPVNPGQHQIEVNCWRPVGPGGYASIVADMRRMFLGYGPQLDDITYLGPNSGQEKKKVSRYFMRTETTGSVRINVNFIHQCNDFKITTETSFPSKRRLQLAAQKARMLAKNDVTTTVIDAYRQARRRMQQAREKSPMKALLPTKETTTIDKKNE